MEVIALLIKIGVAITCILVGSRMGERRGRRKLGALLGFLLGPIGLLILLLVPVVEEQRDERPQPMQESVRLRTRCSECRTTLKAPLEAEGKRFRCGSCGTTGIVEVFA